MWPRIYALVVLCLGIGFGQGRGQTVHLVIFTDDNDETIGYSTAIDRDMVKRVFKDQLAGQLKLVEIPPHQMHVAQIVSALHGLAINPGDSVCVYYSGHGFYTANRQPMLQLGGSIHDILPRGEIVDIVMPKRPYVFALITDCCAYSTADYGGLVRGPANKELRTWTVQYPQLLKGLFFDSPAFIDITSSKPYQVSMATRRGGVFTRSLCEHLRRYRYDRQPWDQVFRSVRAAVASDYELVEPHHSKQPFHAYGQLHQKTQTPYAFRSMYGRNVNDARLGVTSDSQALITRVLPGSIAQQQNLRRGERIVRVNEQPIHNQQELMLALLYSARELELELHNPFNGQRRTVSMVLPW